MPPFPLRIKLRRTCLTKTHLAVTRRASSDPSSLAGTCLPFYSVPGLNIPRSSVPCAPDPATPVNACNTMPFSEPTNPDRIVTLSARTRHSVPALPYLDALHLNAPEHNLPSRACPTTPIRTSLHRSPPDRTLLRLAPPAKPGRARPERTSPILSCPVMPYLTPQHHYRPSLTRTHHAHLQTHALMRRCCFSMTRSISSNTFASSTSLAYFVRNNFISFIASSSIWRRISSSARTSVITR